MRGGGTCICCLPRGGCETSMRGGGTCIGCLPRGRSEKYEAHKNDVFCGIHESGKLL